MIERQGCVHSLFPLPPKTCYFVSLFVSIFCLSCSLRPPDTETNLGKYPLWDKHTPPYREVMQPAVSQRSTTQPDTRTHISYTFERFLSFLREWWVDTRPLSDTTWKHPGKTSALSKPCLPYCTNKQ